MAQQTGSISLIHFREGGLFKRAVFSCAYGRCISSSEKKIPGIFLVLGLAHSQTNIVDIVAFLASFWLLLTDLEAAEMVADRFRWAGQNRALLDGVERFRSIIIGGGLTVSSSRSRAKPLRKKGQKR